MSLPLDIKARLSQPDIPPYSPRQTKLLYEQRRVVLVILDGVSQFVFDQAHIPTMRRLQKRGFSFNHCVTTTPTITASAHTSIHTGTYPAVHGVGLPVDYSPGKGFHPASPSSFNTYIADSLRQHGMSSAAVSDGTAKNSFVSVYGEGFFGHSISGVAEEWRHVFKRYKPSLTTVTFYATDTLGHRFGAGHEVVYQALEEIDLEVARFAEELAEDDELDNTLWIFTADHGMASTVTPINPWVDDAISRGFWVAPNMRCLLMDDELIPELDKVEWVDKIIPQNTCDSLGLKVPKGRSLVCVKRGFGYHGPKPEVANHGGFTEDERRVPLVLSGAGVAGGTSDNPVETVDIAPTIAEALGGAWLDTFTGRVLMEAFGQNPTPDLEALTEKRRRQYEYLQSSETVLENEPLS